MGKDGDDVQDIACSRCGRRERVEGEGAWLGWNTPDGIAVACPACQTPEERAALAARAARERTIRGDG